MAINCHFSLTGTQGHSVHISGITPSCWLGALRVAKVTPVAQDGTVYEIEVEADRAYFEPPPIWLTASPCSVSFRLQT